MEQLLKVIEQVMPAVIKEVNEVRIPALEAAWGRSFRDEMANEDQVTVEIAKNYARPLNNALFRHVNALLPEFREHTTNGSDYVFGSTLIEDKNSFSEGASWVGNGFQKTSIHLLKKFKVNQDGRIEKAFVALVDLSRCASAWSAKTVKTNRSVISFTAQDKAHLQVAVGSLKINRKYIHPVLTAVA